MLVFELSMPNVNTWNGKWTGEGRYYALIKNLGKSKSARELEEKILSKKSFGYDFGDGWFARIDVRRVSGREVTAIRKKSVGFCGYEWMVDSIVDRLEIQSRFTS